MRCIAANRSVLTALDQNATLSDDNSSNQTAMTNDIGSMDIIQFADGWYSYPDLNTFNSDLLLDTLTIRVNEISSSCIFISHRSFYLAYQTIEDRFSLEYQSR